MGTPLGLANSGDSDAHSAAGVVKRLFGCAAFSVTQRPGTPCQSTAWAGGGSSCPSHHVVPSGRSATLV